jgi:hypothetical protein
LSLRCLLPSKCQKVVLGWTNPSSDPHAETTNLSFGHGRQRSLPQPPMRRHCQPAQLCTATAAGAAIIVQNIARGWSQRGLRHVSDLLNAEHKEPLQGCSSLSYVARIVHLRVGVNALNGLLQTALGIQLPTGSYAF